MVRKKISLLVAELLGTGLLTLAVLAEANSNVLVNRTWFVAATAGLMVGTLVLTIGSVSGAHVNPAITVAMWTLRKIETTTAVVYVAAQMLGAAVALRLFQYLQNDQLQNIAGGFDWRVFTAEVLGAFILAFGVAAVVSQKLSGVKAAFAVGASLMLGVLIAGTASNGILNPAVALGLNSWNWAYGAAPVLGAVLGMNVYDLLLTPDLSYSGLVVRKSAVPPVGAKPKKKKTK